MSIKVSFILVFSIYLFLEFFQNLIQTQKFARPIKVIQSFLLAGSVFYLVIQQVLPRGLFSVQGWIFGLLLGHILYTLGFFITVGFHPIIKIQLLSLLKLIHFSFLSPVILGRTFTVALSEEIIYRAVIQSVLIETLRNVPLAILIVAVAFTLVHEHIFQNHRRQNIEFLLFSVIIGIFYYITNDLGFVTIIHFIRNMESIYLEFQEKNIEIKDTNKCLDELEKMLFQTGGVL